MAEFTTRYGGNIKSLPKKTGIEMDAYWEIKFRQATHRFYVEAKGELRQSNLTGIIRQFGTERDMWLLVARYIPAPLKDQLKKNGINYLEATGNCYINTGHIFFYVNDQQVKEVRRAPVGKLWNATGLKFLFVILQDPDMLSAPYRKIAHAAGIALGNISDLLNELRQGGYLKLNAKKEEKLIHRDRLIERWVELFDVVLKPKLFRGHFRFLQKEQKEWKSPAIEGIYWGGEPGADLYLNYLVPEKFTLYTITTGNELVKQLRIVPDDAGNITILDKFWNDWPGDGKIEKKPVAPPLLIYAELRNDPDSRNGQAAEKIKKKYLDGK